METIGERVARLRIAKGMNQSELARTIGKRPQVIQALEAGTVTHPRYLLDLARALKVTPHYLEYGQNDKVIETVPVNVLRVEGTSQAGTFRDIAIFDDDETQRETIPVARDGRFPLARQYALRIAGDSMNKLFPDGCFVTCVAWDECGLAMKDGMILHVERHQGHLVETTIKSVRFVAGAPHQLMPMSTNPVHKPIRLEGDENTEILVKGLVTGKWEPVSY